MKAERCFRCKKFIKNFEEIGEQEPYYPYEYKNFCKSCVLKHVREDLFKNNGAS